MLLLFFGALVLILVRQNHCFKKDTTLKGWCLFPSCTDYAMCVKYVARYPKAMCTKRYFSRLNVMTRFRHMLLMQYMFHDEMRVVDQVNGCII